MNKIARFEKVSYTQFLNDFKEMYTGYTEDQIQEIYDAIKLPKRATKGSAGYDYFAPIQLEIKPNETIRIPTGIRCFMEEGWVLMNFPRSGLGFKYRMQLNNTVGIIDSDYYYAKNEGHIMCKITNDTNESKTIEVAQGDGFIQGVFMQYGLCVDDEVDSIREGGFGSTTKKA